MSLIKTEEYFYPTPIKLSHEVRTPPPKIIEYFKVVAEAPLTEYIKQEGTYHEHRWVKIGANSSEMRKLPFKLYEAEWFYENWIEEGRERMDMQLLTLGVVGLSTDPMEKINKVANWIYNNVEYKLNTEAPPWKLITSKITGITGDCSSFAPLTSCMLGLAGIKCWEKLVVFWGDYAYGHIYVLADTPSGFVVVDPTAPPLVGREPANISAYSFFEQDKTVGVPEIKPPDEEPLWLPTPFIPFLEKAAPWIVLTTAALVPVFLLKEKREAAKI